MHRAFARRVIAAVALAGMIAAGPPAVRADDWIGQKVFCKDSAQPRVGTRNVGRELIPYPVTVTAVDGDWLWLHRAWVRKSDVMTADQSITYHTEQIRRNPSADWAYCNRAAAWKAKGDLDNALADETEAIRLDPADAITWNNRGSTWLAKGETENAIKDYTEAIRLKPSEAMTYANRGSVHLDSGDFPSAIRDCTEAIRLDPGLGQAYAVRAFARTKAGDFKRAAGDWESALRIDGTSVVAMNGLAWLRATCPDAACRNGGRAVELARRACELTDWEDYGYLDTLAAAHAEAGDFAAAAETQRKVLGLARTGKADAEQIGQCTARLELYEAGAPYRDEPTEKNP